MRKWYFDLLRAFGHLRKGWYRLRTPSVRLDEDSRRTFYYHVWRSAAKSLNAEFIPLPNGFCDVRFGNRSTRIYENIVKIDDPLVVKLVRVKPFVHKLLSEHGIPVPAHCEFTLDAIERAYEFLESTGSPCVVKPASGEAAGFGVTTHVSTRRDVLRAAINASLFSKDLLMEQQIAGDSYRFLCFDGEVLDVTRRRSPHVVGDGQSTVRQLIEIENRRREAMPEALTRIQIDADCRGTLKNAGLSLRSVPETGREVSVKTAVNDNAVQDNVSVLSAIGDPLKEEMVKATTVLGIRLAGIDVITNNPSVPLREGRGSVIEVNSSPGLHHHYNVMNPEASTSVAIPILSRLLGLEVENEVIASQIMTQP